eukprot:14193039-Ditylum_brightwellii.AAC.1
MGLNLPRNWKSDMENYVDSLLTRVESFPVVPYDDTDYETLSNEEITLSLQFVHMMDNKMIWSVLTNYHFGELYSDSLCLNIPFHEASINNIHA